MGILVDSNEAMRSPVLPILDKMGIHYKVKPLKVGDFKVNGVRVERKAVGDLFSSKHSGHLDKQLYEMSFNADLSYLIIEGDIMGYMIENNIPRNVFQSIYLGISFKVAPDGHRGRIIPLLANNHWDTAALLKYLLDKSEKNEPRLPKIERAAFSSDDRILFILSAFPNLGDVRAKRLLDRYGTLRRVFSLTSWKKVDGIGPKINRQSQELLDRKYSEGHHI